MKGTSYYRSRT